jgi:excisionase family DNA binding protein
MTVADVQDYLRMSPASVYRGLNRGEIPAERVGGKWIIKRKAFFDKFGWPLAGPAERQPRLSATQNPHETGALHFQTASTDTRATKAESIQASDVLRLAEMVEVDEVMKEPNPASRGTPENPWRDVADAAARLNCSEAHVRTLCRSQRIRFYRVGRHYFFVDKWLDEYIDKHSGGDDAA